MRSAGPWSLLVMFLVLVAAGPASAATFAVTGPADAVDANPGDGACASAADGCTLRAGFQEANALAGADTISLPAGTYTLTLPGDDDASAVGDLDATSPISLEGASARTTIIDGGGIDGVLYVLATQVSVSGVTIRNGGATAGGGGYAISNSGDLTVSDSAVVGNSAGGIVDDTNTTLALLRTLVADNTGGGGLYNRGTATVETSTFAGNTGTARSGADPARGAITANSSTGDLTITNSTIAGNSAGIDYAAVAAAPIVGNTLLADNSGVDCGLPVTSLGQNLESGTSCGFTGTGDIQNADPLLGPLSDNGGPTDTRALTAGSPAIDAGGSGCQPADQRGYARPVGVACDIGAFELQAASGSGGGGGSAPPATGGNSAPSPTGGGSAPSPTVAAPTAGVEPFGNTGQSSAGSAPLPPPAMGVTATVSVVRGIVRVKRRGRRRFTVLTGARQIPIGSTIDVRDGVIRLTTASDAQGHVQTANFWGGIFLLGQKRARRPITDIRLVQRIRGCPRHPRRGTATRKRSLWGHGNGRFRTTGRYSSATVRGTWWYVEDRCDGTFNRVRRGTVHVRDLVRHATTAVHAGHTYFAGPTIAARRRYF